ncbi:MAG: RND family transporter [Methanomicrobiales archaeon]|nr:RND family transporter [Methanomicrobiales archaeon]
MQSPFFSLAGAINRYPGIIALLVCCVAAVALYGTTLTSMETGYDTYVDTGSERGILLAQYSDTFLSDAIMILVEGDDVTDPAVIAYLDRIARDCENEQYVSGVTALSDLLAAANGGTLPVSDAAITAAAGRLPEATLSLILPSPSMTIIVVTPEPGMSLASEEALLKALESRIALADTPPGITASLTGSPAFESQMSAEMGSSMGTLILAALALMVVAVGLLFGHVRYRLLSVAIVATGLVFTFGFMGLAGMKINMVTIAAFPVLIGIGIDYAIQFHSRFDEEARQGSLADAVAATITRSGPSVLYAMLATSMGFLAMWISPLPMIRSFGMVCVIGVVSCYLAALIIVPTAGTLLSYRPRPAAAGDSPLLLRYNGAIGTVVERVAKNPLPVLLVCSLVAIAGIQIDSTIPVNTNENTFVPADMPAKVNLDKVVRTMGPTSTVPVYVRGDGVVSLAGLTWMHDFQVYEEEHNAKITGSHSIVTEVLAVTGGTMPESEAALDEALAAIPAETVARYADGRTAAVIEFSLVEMENEVAMSFIDGLKREIAWFQPPPGITATITGEGEMFTNLIREIREGKTAMTLLGFSLIFLFLFAVYRKGKKAATPLVPIVLIVGWNGVMMHLLGIEYTPMTATLGSMTIGVASEYTILIMERCYEERERGLALIPAIRASVQKIGTAITVSGLTTVFGFSALMLSSFGIISNFGILTVISVGFALLGAILVMPAILALTAGREHAAGAPDGAAAA